MILLNMVCWTRSYFLMVKSWTGDVAILCANGLAYHQNFTTMLGTIRSGLLSAGTFTAATSPRLRARSLRRVQPRYRSVPIRIRRVCQLAGKEGVGWRRQFQGRRNSAVGTAPINGCRTRDGDYAGRSERRDCTGRSSQNRET